MIKGGNRNFLQKFCIGGCLLCSSYSFCSLIGRSDNAAFYIAAKLQLSFNKPLSIFFLIFGKNIYIMQKQQKKLSKLRKSILLGGGGLVGFVGGFFGGGGGMLAVPLLNKAGSLETKQSHASAMMVILPMSFAAAITYFFKGFIEWQPTLFSGAGVLVGGVIGALLLKKLKSFVVAIIFALCMIVIGIKLVFFQ